MYASVSYCNNSTIYTCTLTKIRFLTKDEKWCHGKIYYKDVTQKSAFKINTNPKLTLYKNSTKRIQDKVVPYGSSSGSMIIETILFKLYNFVLENGNHFKLFQTFPTLNSKKAIPYDKM